MYSLRVRDRRTFQNLALMSLAYETSPCGTSPLTHTMSRRPTRNTIVAMRGSRSPHHGVSGASRESEEKTVTADAVIEVLSTKNLVLSHVLSFKLGLGQSIS